ICAFDGARLRAAKRPDFAASGPFIALVDLLCGCGGLTLGVEEAARARGLGLDIKLAVDVDDAAIAVYRENFPQAQTSTAPVEEVFEGDLGTALTQRESVVKAWLGGIDVLVGGPPC